MRPFCSSLLLLFMVSMTTNLRSQQIEAVPPTPATEVADSFRTLDGFQMTVIAAEPLVTDPVALCYDAKGRLYVAEMNDYPYTDKATHKPMQENPTDRPIGKIRRLEDTDGDGRFDSATVFAESLSWPTGIAAWKDGIFVTAAPDLWYLKDTDGDGKADVRERILTGYRKYNVQAEVNNPIWGLDHQLYIASASNGGRIYVPAAGSGSAVDLGRNDIRIDPNDLSKFEKITGGIQFGNTFDDWGNRFLCNNSLPLVHAVFPMSALDRNPWLPTRRAVENCPDPNEPIQLFPTTSIEGWRLQRYKDREHVPRKGYRPPRGLKPGDPSSPTSSSAPIVYRGDAYPERHRGTVFVAEPCYNLVYRLKLEPVGPTFIARKPASDNASDMVTSRDVWFRPICFANAPDGCLHIADFYRESIEHPWSLPEDFHARMDLERGKDRGRIYRLEPPGFQPRAAPHLDELSSQDLVPLLAHPNAWHRETAHRLLFERQDSTVANAVRGLLSKSEAPLGRLHALWTLHGLGLLQENDVAASLRDAASGVRVNAVRLACLKAREWPALLETLANCAADPDAAVRFEVALALGEFSDPRNDAVASALVRLSKKDANDDWIRLAILSSVALHAPAVLARLLADDAFATSTESSEIWAPLARMVGAGNPAPRWEALLAQLAERKTTDRTAMAVTRGLAAGLRAAKAKLSDVANRVKGGSDFLESQMLEAGRRAVLRAEEEPIRVQAIELLENASFETASPILESLLASDQPSSVHSSAAKALSAIAAGHPEVGDLLLSHWSGYSGEMRSQVVQLLLAKKDRLGGLLDALASGLVQPYQIGPAQRDLLLHHEDPKIRTKAESVFAATECRHLVVEQYKKVPQMNGDPAAGKTLFNSVCIACHKFYDSGVIDLAPNLAVVADWEPERILVNILDPNREVAPEFMEHVITTTSGDVITGRVTAESSGGISLKLADNSVRDIRREDIRRFENTGRSLMPEGLEAAITPKAMADLIAFLKSRP